MLKVDLQRKYNMKLSSYVFIGIIYICNIVNGAAVTDADCGDPVSEGDPQILTCHITGSIVYGIGWFREGNTNRIITCGNTSKICISSNETLYSVNSTTSHPDNKLQFTIKSASAEDFTKKWICIDGDYYPDPSTTGSSCTLSESAAVTVADCGDPVSEGDPQVLTCHITGSLVYGINWFREGDRNRIITCGNTPKICISNNETLYSVNSTAHPDNKLQFTIKSVIAEDFTKKWICSDGTSYPGTSCTLSESAAVTVADCGDPVSEGDPQVLTCHITGSLVYGINWFREGDTNRIITCGRTSQICISNNPMLYSVNSTAHPDNKLKFTINSVSAEDFTKKWICIDGATYSDPTTTDTGCTVTKLPPSCSTPSTVSTPITENTTPTTWIVVGCIMTFIAGLCCGILGVLIYLKRLNLHCGHTKKNSDTAAVTYDVDGAGDVNTYDGLNMEESTDNPSSPVYINQTTNSYHPPASSIDYINHTSSGGDSNPGHPPASSRYSINQTSGSGGSNPVNTYEHLATAYTNENSYETL